MELNFRYRTRSKVRSIVVVVSCVLWKKVFMATFSVAESMQVSPHHVSFKYIYSHFKVFKFKNFAGKNAPGAP